MLRVFAITWPLVLTLTFSSDVSFLLFKVAICGPLTHIPQTAIWLAILAISRPGDVSLNVYAPVGDHFWTNLVAAAIM